MTTRLHRPTRCLAVRLAPAVALVTVLAACTSAGATALPTATGTPPAEATGSPSAAPSEPAGNLPGGEDPGPGGDGFVIPRPGQLDVHPIAADAFAARVDGRHVVLTITYTSGVEPCSVLDTIVVQRGEGSFAITLREGHGPGDQVCIMIAKVMRTQVDFGELAPGTYTISDTMRGAEPIQVVVS